MNGENYPGESQQPPLPPTGSEYSAGRAALFGIVLGMGAVYNREYMKAVIHFAIFAWLVIIADAVPVFGLAAFSFYAFTIFDAYRSAESIIRKGGPDKVKDNENELNLPVWGGVLLLMGVVFLLDNLGAIRLRSMTQFIWPGILIGLGAYLIFTYFEANKRRVGDQSGALQPAARAASRPAEAPPPVAPEVLPVDTEKAGESKGE